MTCRGRGSIRAMSLTIQSDAEERIAKRAGLKHHSSASQAGVNRLSCHFDLTLNRSGRKAILKEMD